MFSNGIITQIGQRRREEGYGECILRCNFVSRVGKCILQRVKYKARGVIHDPFFFLFCFVVLFYFALFVSQEKKRNRNVMT